MDQITPVSAHPDLAHPRPGIVGAAVYANGQRVQDLDRIADAKKWTDKPGHVVWIGLFEPGDDLLHEIQQQFDLHPLAIEDAHKAHQRPKLEQYGKGLFVVARTSQLINDRIAFGETHMFVGPGYVVTVRHGASSSYRAVRERAESCPTTLANGEDFILYSVLDFIVDEYAPVLDQIRSEVEALEDCLLKRPLSSHQIERLYTLRRDLLRLRDAAAPLTEVCHRIEHAEVVQIDAEMQPLFRDVTDHIHRVKEDIDSLREVLAFAFETSLMIGQSQQTVVTRQLAAWAAILAVPTALAGIYGMNFEHMPELKWQYGYPAVLCLIGSVCAGLYWRFHRNGWL
jgi:magnesium transporter